jgi:tRNA(Ile)-lysidine synthase
MNLKNLSVKNKIPKFFKSHLNNKKVYQVYKKFEKSIDINDNFAVAVSGGPDSLALSFLAKIYSIKKKVDVKFFIVDHKLRQSQRARQNL